MTIREYRTFCRICCANCGMVVSIDEASNTIVRIKGDRDNPMTRGYVCFKGMRAAELHHGPARLLQPLKRQPDGSFLPIPSERAIEEIAAAVRVLLERHGPESIAGFIGTQGYLSATYEMHQAFLQAIGSSQFYSIGTIDQSAKLVNFERQGGWGAGLQDLSQSDVLLFFGCNPLISHSTMPVMSPDPARMLREAKARGLRLICIDPRLTETARLADLFLQALPGRDAAIAAALIRIVLMEGWEDRDFVREHVGPQRMADLAAAVAPFTAERVEHAAGLQPGQLRAVAQLFARDCRRGAAYASTGPSMAPFSNLMQHLVETLNIVCGRLRRAGDKAVVDMLSPVQPVHAEVIAPPRSWDAVPPSRIRGVGRLGMDRLSSTLAEEILTPGAGQVRALFVNGANPVATMPDQKKFHEAVKSLDLLVTIEPFMTATAQLAHYVLPPRLMFERHDLPLSLAGYPFYPVSWGNYTPPILPPPAGSDVVEDGYVYWALARHLGVPLVYHGVTLSSDVPPTAEELLRLRLAHAPASLDELKRDPGGRIFDPPSAVVQPPRPGANATFDVMPADVGAELAQLLASAEMASPLPGDGFTHLLSTRRLRQVMNSTGLALDSVRRHAECNAAYLNPRELAQLGVTAGDTIEIRSAHGCIRAIAAADATLREGVVSIAHGWGGPSGTAAPGVNVNELVSCTVDVQPINAMPRMSALPVTITRCA